MVSSIFLALMGILLLIFGIIDFKVKAIPSIFLTAVLFEVLIFNEGRLFFGILGFVIAYLLYEADFFSGIADIKVMTMISLLVSSMNWFLGFILLTAIFGFFWKVMIKWKMKKEKETAFIPVFFFIYLSLWLVGGIA